MQKNNLIEPQRQNHAGDNLLHVAARIKDGKAGKVTAIMSLLKHIGVPLK